MDERMDQPNATTTTIISSAFGERALILDAVSPT